MSGETLGRVGVFMGGPSAEREISKRSGMAVYQALAGAGVSAVPCVVPEAGDPAQAVRAMTRAQELDLAFVALHGAFGEDGRVQRVFEELGVPYTGSSSDVSAVAINKMLTRACLQEKGLTVPYGFVVNRAAWRAQVADPSLIGPLGEIAVVKPIDQGSSIGVHIVPTRQLSTVVEDAFVYGEQALIEAYVAGREVTVGLLGDRALPVIEIVTKRGFFDFTAKYETGQTDYRVPALLEAASAQRVQDAARAAHRLLGCRDLSRVDMILTPSGCPVILEVNTIPGFTATSLLPKAAAAVGIGFAELCLQVLRFAAQRQPAPVEQ